MSDPLVGDFRSTAFSAAVAGAVGYLTARLNYRGRAEDREAKTAQLAVAERAGFTAALLERVKLLEQHQTERIDEYARLLHEHADLATEKEKLAEALAEERAERRREGEESARTVARLRQEVEALGRRVADLTKRLAVHENGAAGSGSIRSGPAEGGS